jgi:hypothetical protein
MLLYAAAVIVAMHWRGAASLVRRSYSLKYIRSIVLVGSEARLATGRSDILSKFGHRLKDRQRRTLVRAIRRYLWAKKARQAIVPTARTKITAGRRYEGADIQ